MSEKLIEWVTQCHYITLKELNIISVTKTKTINGDYDSNSYKVELDNLFKYIGVGVEKANVYFEKANGILQESQRVGVEKVSKNTNKNKNINTKSNLL